MLAQCVSINCKCISQRVTTEGPRVSGLYPRMQHAPLRLPTHMPEVRCCATFPYRSVLPTYDIGPYTAGAAAPVLLAIFRVLQASAGGVIGLQIA